MLKNEKGFTLIEMLIVLMIISVLIILIVPNINKNTEGIDEKGCTALVSVVQAQVQLYHVNEGKLPENLDALVKADYIEESQTKCSNNVQLKYDKGVVSKG